jgi:hypothetical protein
MIKCLQCQGRGYKEYFSKKTLKLEQKICKFCNGTTQKQTSNIFEDLNSIFDRLKL